MSSKKTRLVPLDAFRGLASLAVVLFHYTVRYFELYGDAGTKPLFRVSHGSYGVDLFFILSGFVIFFSIEKYPSSKRFLISRFFRLFPVYIISVIITALAVNGYGLEGRTATLSQVLINFTMVQEFLGYENVDGVYWTLAIELSFYIAILFILIFKLREKIFLLISIWGIAYLMMYAVGFEQVIPKSLGRIKVLLDYSFLFCLGICLNKFWSSKDLKFLILSAFFFIIYWLVTGVAHFYVGLFIYLLFVAFTFGKLNFLNSRGLIFLGNISYPLYLIHQNFGYVILSYCSFIEINLRILLTLAIVIFLSWLIHKHVENPAMKFAKNQIKKLNL